MKNLITIIILLISTFSLSMAQDSNVFIGTWEDDGLSSESGIAIHINFSIEDKYQAYMEGKEYNGEWRFDEELTTINLIDENKNDIIMHLLTIDESMMIIEIDGIVFELEKQ
ncbi:MAG: hypothetical protein ACPG4Z_04750 [Chitinophagales bacterium]